MKKPIIALILIALAFSTSAEAAKGKRPCSGKKGGVASCTADGKFMCKDGSISASKKVCK